MFDWLGKYFSDINLLSLRPEIMSLPFDKIGNEMFGVIRSNLKIIELFFHKIAEFNYFQFYFKEIKQELSEFHPNLGCSSSLKEFKTVLSIKLINIGF